MNTYLKKGLILKSKKDNHEFIVLSEPDLSLVSIPGDNFIQVLDLVTFEKYITVYKNNIWLEIADREATEIEKALYL